MALAVNLDHWLRDVLIGVPWWSAPVAGGTVFFVVLLMLVSDRALAPLGPLLGGLAGLTVGFGCLRGWWDGRVRRRLVERQRAREHVGALSWQQFERLVAQVYRARGYAVRENWRSGADGGVDLVLSRNGQRLFVQCKHWPAGAVSVHPVRELWGVVAGPSVHGGIIVTSGTFTSAARLWTADKNLRLVDGEELLTLCCEHAVRNASSGS
jgi:restriction system protein